jgi:UDP-N-acetyl-D-mannosaminuronate dehydrogenase
MDEWPSSVGTVESMCELEIRDEDDNVVDDGEVGEICIRGAVVFLGYWDNPEASAKALDERRWYRTGDYGRIADGVLYLESRMRDMIIRGGENIYPIEIEHRLEEHPEVAEAAKLFENTFRQVNIALVNEFAQIAHALGISVHETLEAANTKPYGFMKFNPSAGVGGHCIPVDPTYLAHVSAEKGVPATFIERANVVNLDMPKYIVSRVEIDNGGSLKGKKVQVIGVSYKPNVADTRETPSALVIDELKNRGAIVTWNDEVVGNWRGESSTELGGSEIVIVVTLHDSVNKELILSSAPYVFDTTGKLPGAKQL